MAGEGGGKWRQEKEVGSGGRRRRWEVKAREGGGKRKQEKGVGSGSMR